MIKLPRFYNQKYARQTCFSIIRRGSLGHLLLQSSDVEARAFLKRIFAILKSRTEVPTDCIKGLYNRNKK